MTTRTVGGGKNLWMKQPVCYLFLFLFSLFRTQEKEERCGACNNPGYTHVHKHTRSTYTNAAHIQTHFHASTYTNTFSRMHKETKKDMNTTRVRQYIQVMQYVCIINERANLLYNRLGYPVCNDRPWTHANMIGKVLYKVNTHTYDHWTNLPTGSLKWKLYV